MAKICVPVCVSHLRELADAVRTAAEVADIIELRLDYLRQSELSQASEAIATLLKSIDRPVILTLRPAEQGGASAITAQERLDFYLENAHLLRPDRDDLWDLELDLAQVIQERALEGDDLVGEWRRTICSYHNLTGVPADLEKIYESMAATDARILKIAVQADDAIDCLPIFNLLERAQREGREMIAIAMGEAGVMTRILSPARGSFLTFASLAAEKGSAPGQITTRDLRDVYRVDRIDRATQLFGIAGRPVSHSLSPYIHNATFAAIDLNAAFIPFDVGDVIQFVRRMVHPKTRELAWNLSGLSVTAPHKSMVMQCLDWIDVAAREMGAVNTIVVKDNELHGHNTDAAGFLAPLKNRKEPLEGLRCAVIGAGGAARSVVWGLKGEGAIVTLFARDQAKGKTLSDYFEIDCRELVNANFGDFDVVVNATPLGTRGKAEQETPATSEQLRGVRLAYDLVYNPSATRFLSEARAAGCETIGGLEMLIAQAVEQFKLWTGKSPKVDVMRAAATRRLGIE